MRKRVAFVLIVVAAALAQRYLGIFPGF